MEIKLWVCDKGHVVGPTAWWSLPLTCTNTPYSPWVYCGAPVREVIMVEKVLEKP